jgi:hypothetical protein
MRCQPLPAGPVIFRPGRVTSAGIAVLGLLLCLLGLAMPLVARGGLFDVLMALVFVTVPSLVGGSIALLQGWLRLWTRIAVDATGVELRIPTWAGGCYLPLRHVGVRWDEIHGITCQQIVYGPVAMVSVPVTEYTLQTARGRYTLTRAFCPQVETLIRLLSGNTGLQVEALAAQRRLGWGRPPDR